MFDDELWKLKGKCFNSLYPDDWFAGVASSGARKLCEGCPVQSECLSYALNSNIGYGVWGGLTERERRKLQRQMNRFLLKLETLKKEQLRDAAEPPIAS